MQRSALCRSLRELSNEYLVLYTIIYYLLANIGFDTAEDEPCKACRILRRVRSSELPREDLRSAARRGHHGVDDHGYIRWIAGCCIDPMAEVPHRTNSHFVRFPLPSDFLPLEVVSRQIYIAAVAFSGIEFVNQ